MGDEAETRPHIRLNDRIAVWAAAAGRCTFCNRLVLENEELGEPVPIGELAHNVGWTERSPRGESELDRDQRRAASNLILTCGTCHKPIDQGGVIGRYDVPELAKRKQEHEARIRFLGEIGADRAAYVVRMVGPVRGTPPALTRGTILAAATAAGIYPQRLRGAHWEDIDLDLRPLGERSTRAHFEACLPAVDDLVARVHDGVRRDAIDRVAVFAFARIPLLIALGARLDDKLSTLVFQRHRRDDLNAWRWPDDPGSPVSFSTKSLQEGDDRTRVALVVSLSGTIQLEEIPPDIRGSHTIYGLVPVHPAEPGPAVINSPRSLANFEATVRRFLASVEANHGKIERISLFPAVPLSAAVTLGRVLMPNVSPSWQIFDRDEHNQFFDALEIKP